MTSLAPFQSPHVPTFRRVASKFQLSHIENAFQAYSKFLECVQKKALGIVGGSLEFETRIMVKLCWSVTSGSYLLTGSPKELDSVMRCEVRMALVPLWSCEAWIGRDLVSIREGGLS